MRILPAIAVLLLSGVPALACTPAPWQGEVAPTAQQVGDEVLSRQPEFLGKVQIVNVSKDDGDSTRYDVKVLKQYIGEPVTELAVTSDETNSCAFTGRPDDVLLVALNKNVEEKFSIFLLSNYFYGLPETDIEAYLDSWKANGGVIPAPAPTAAAVTESGASVITETVAPAAQPVANETTNTSVPEEPAQ